MHETAPTTAPPARKRPAPRKPSPAGHLVRYARVSTAEQDPALQLDALTSAGCWRVCTDHASGSREDRPELAAALDHVRSGDTLVVWRLDRLGRSLPHLIDTVTGLAGRGVGFWSVTEAIDTTTAGGRLVFHVFGALAEFERQLIRDGGGVRRRCGPPQPGRRPAVSGVGRGGPGRGVSRSCPSSAAVCSWRRWASECWLAGVRSG